jgi:hypothetical protein
MPEFQAHMPDEWGGNSKTERTFFWDILVTLAPEFVEELIKDCRRQRLTAAQQRVNVPRPINLAPNWVEALLAQPFISRCSASSPSVLIVRNQPQQRQIAPPQR